MVEDTMLVDLNIDKSNWLPVKFGDVVKEVRESTANPEADGLHRIVGLEHIEPENIHLNNWGELADSITFSRIFRKGQMLFGKRRPYLKKVALAGFDGICSGDIIVMEAKEDILPGLLPFLVCNDKFFEHAVKTSAGSLSPRTKFKDLAEYEFLLPPLEQQAKFAELLWSGDEMINAYKDTFNSLKKLLETSINQMMINGLFSDDRNVKTKCGLVNEKIQVQQLKDCLSELPSYGANASSKPWSIGDPRYIRITDIDDQGELIFEDKVAIDLDDYSNYILLENDFLFARTGATVGKTYLHKNSQGSCVYAGYLIRFRVDETKLLAKYLFYFSKSQKFDAFKKSTIKVGAQPNINAQEYMSMYLPVPTIDKQSEIVRFLDSLEENLSAVDTSMKLFNNVQKSMINQIFKNGHR